MMLESLEGYDSASASTGYEEPGKQAPMGFMAPGEEFHDAGNDSDRKDQKQSSFFRSTYS